MAQEDVPLPGSIEFRPIAELTPDPNNARTHTPEQVEQIVRSIEAFGWTMPIAVDDVIRAGNARRAAAALLYERGATLYMAPGRAAGGVAIPAGCVPCLDCSGWTDEQRRAYALADNKLALNAGWDEDRLREEMIALESIDFDLSITGFDPGEITQLVISANEAIDAYEHWSGMPEFDQQDKRAFRTIPLHFGSQEDVDKFAALIGQKITDQTRYVWFPETPIERYADKQYAPEED